MSISTTKRKAAPSKAAASKPTDSKGVTAAEKPAPTAVTTPGTTPDPVDASSPDAIVPDLKKRELIDLVVERSGIKKKDAKPVIEAMLAILGKTIADGRELNLQPLGKLRINRTSDKGNGRVIFCKLRQSMPNQNATTDDLAEAPGNL